MHTIDQILTDKLLQSLDENYPLSLCYGKMGICIYMYLMSKNGKEIKYVDIASKLLDEILEKSHSLTSANFEDGLAGIGVGLTYLVKKGYVNADLNVLLSDLDNVIYKYLIFDEDESSLLVKDILGYLFYYYLRLKEQKSTDNYIEKNMIIFLVDTLSRKINDSFLDSYEHFSIFYYYLPLMFYVFSTIYALDIYNEKIMRILNDWKEKIISRIPILHMNRIYLLWGILSCKNLLIDDKWEYYISTLKNNIDINRLIFSEIKVKNIFISNGFSLLYILLEEINRKYGCTKFAYDRNLIKESIEKSPAWIDLINDPYYYRIHSGLINGFLGVNIVLNHMKKNI